MKRRTILGSALGLPAAWAAPAPAQTAPPPAETAVKLEFASPETAAAGVRRFFDETEFAALERLGRLLVPPGEGLPGAAEAEAAMFLDFLIGQSPAERQTLYREGLRALREAARRQWRKEFAAVNDEEAAPLLAPLRQPWTRSAPRDPLARFLLAAKDDFWQAVANSRALAQALSSRRRGASGLGLYWHAVE
jgi:hypothetical protein